MGQVPNCFLLIPPKADVNVQYDKSYGSAKTVRLLISHGADVNALDMTDSTPLHMASFSWTPEVVRILIENGASVNVQNETHLTPLHRASFLGNPENVRLLIEHGADVTALDWSHKTPLHLASSLVSVETCHSYHGAELMRIYRTKTSLCGHGWQSPTQRPILYAY